MTLLSNPKVKEIFFLERYHNSPGMDKAILKMREIFGGREDLYKDNLGTTWMLPPYYEVVYAYIENNKGEKIFSTKDSSLFLWSYSTSVENKTVSWEELDSHITTDKNRPEDYIFNFRLQYRHWVKNWGFSIPWNKYKKLSKKDSYKINIKTNFLKRDLKQYFIGEPKSRNNIILVSHLDHPVQFNDGLSGCLSINLVHRKLSKKLKNINLIALNTVEIIGSVLFLKKYSLSKKNTPFALNINGSAINSPFEIQFGSIDEDSQIEKCIKNLVEIKLINVTCLKKFREGWGNDEIAFQAPGVSIPCPSIYRSPFENYHTSSDNMENLNEDNFSDTNNLIEKLLLILDENYFIEEIFIDHLPCLSNPDVDLYLSPQNMSGLERNEIGNKFIEEFLSCDTKNKNFIINNPTFLNNFMNRIIAFLPNSKNYSIVEISYELAAPPELVLIYLQAMENKGFLKLSLEPKL